MRSPNRNAVLIGCVLVAACFGDSPVDPRRTRDADVATLTPVSPTELTATAGAFLDGPVVKALDRDGNAVRGAVVRFTHPTDGARIERPSATTDESGMASAGTWRVGTLVGTYSLAARVGNLAPVVFSATAHPGAAHTITMVAGSEQLAAAGATLPMPLAVRVTDQHGNPIPGVLVTFTPLQDCGSVATPEVVTDMEGRASPGAWTLGPIIGTQRLTASAEDKSVEFLAYSWSDQPCGDGCPGEGRLAFVFQDQIYRSNADGTERVRLTSQGRNRDPAWSPDGRRIAFVSDRAGGCCDLYVMDADGSNVVRRTIIPSDGAGVWKASPAWSPDGRYIAFSSAHGIQYKVMVVSVDGDDPPQSIGFDTGWNSYPAWSPDGRRIAFVSDVVAYDIVYDIYTMNRDGSGIEQLTNLFGIDDNVHDYFQPAWSPDGSRIAYTLCPREWHQCANSSLAVMNADGSGKKILARSAGYARPAWAPDGSRLVFALGSCLRSIRPDGTDVQTVICDAESPAWGRSPVDEPPTRNPRYAARE